MVTERAEADDAHLGASNMVLRFQVDDGLLDLTHGLAYVERYHQLTRLVGLVTTT